MDGFFSVVEHRDHPTMIVVRARYREDLVSVAKKLDLFVQHTPMSDYPYRMICSKEKWALYVAESVRKINYGNFKEAALKGAGTMRAMQYHEVWAAMAGYHDDLTLQRRVDYYEEEADLLDMQEADSEK